MLEILERLCAFDTTSHKSNLECVEYCRLLLTDAGYDVVVLPNKDGDKANLHAFAGSQDRQALVLAGHTDVVPVSGQDWKTNPFKLTRIDDRLIARGAVDMKGFLAVALHHAISQDVTSLTNPLHLVLTHDEETGCFGARDISDYLKTAIAPNSYCIVGEPTDMQPVIAHKGIMGLRTRITGSEGHAAAIATKTNAIHFASDFIQYLLELAQEFAARPVDNAYVTPFSTTQVGLISGGQARNMIAKACEFEFEFRHVPDDCADLFLAGLDEFLSSELRPRLTRNDENAAVEIETLSHVPAFQAKKDGRLLDALQEVLSSSSHGYWDGVTEAGYYLNAGMDTIVCGPGSIAQAHQPGEYVSIDELIMCETVLRDLSDAMGDGSASRVISLHE